MSWLKSLQEYCAETGLWERILLDYFQFINDKVKYFLVNIMPYAAKSLEIGKQIKSLYQKTILYRQGR